MVKRKVLNLIIGITLCTSLMFSEALAVEKKLPPRIQGLNRYETSAEISKEGWEHSKYAILATGEDFADALCAAPLARKYDAPILLTENNNLNLNTLNELKRLKVENVIIVGGSCVVSKDIEGKIKDLKINVERIGGIDRYETSVKIAERVGVKENVVIATGEKFADALSIAPIAAKEGMPILLTEKNKLPEKVESFIKENNIKKSYLIGGEGVIDIGVSNKLKNSYRIGGKNRFDTNAKIIKEFEKKLDLNNIFTAIGDGPTDKEFADALSGAALASKFSAPLLLVNNYLPEEIEGFVREKLNENCSVIAIGGEKVLLPEVLKEIKEAISKKESNNNNTGVIIPSGGENPGNTSNVMPEEVKEKLQSASGRLDDVMSALSKDEEKEIVSMVKNAVESLLSDPNYDYKKDVKIVKAKKNSLTKEEKEELKKAILDNVPISLIGELQNLFDV